MVDSLAKGCIFLASFNAAAVEDCAAILPKWNLSLLVHLIFGCKETLCLCFLEDDNFLNATFPAMIACSSASGAFKGIGTGVVAFSKNLSILNFTGFRRKCSGLHSRSPRKWVGNGTCALPCCFTKAENLAWALI